MIINLYVHKEDLDHLNLLIKSPFLDEDIKFYEIEVYRYREAIKMSAEEMIDRRTTEIVNKYFLVGISYEDFMRIEDYLRFL